MPDQPARNGKHRFRDHLIDGKRGQETMADAEPAVDTIADGRADDVDELIALGKQALRTGQPDRGLAMLEQAVAAGGNRARSHYALGNAQADLYQFDRALASFDRAIALLPDHADAHSQRGIVLLRLKRPAEGLASCLKASMLAPGSANIWLNLGRAFSHVAQHQLAIGAYKKAIALAPDRPFLKGRLLQAKMLCSDWNGLSNLVTDIERSVAAGIPAVHPFYWQAISDSPQSHLLAARQFDLGEARSMPLPMSPRPVSRNRKIRIGYVSGEFSNVANGMTMAGVIDHHDKSSFDIIGFDNGGSDGSAIRDRMVAALDDIVDIRNLSDHDVARIIRARGIDILVNLNGFFGNERSALFALRPSPIQVNYLGCPGTMGKPYMDYMIADSVVVPEHYRQFYDEKIAYLPDSYYPTDRARQIAERLFTRAECGLPQDAFVFCCFNHNHKVNPDTFDVWMRILRRIERSVLWLIDANADASANLRSEAAARGVDSGRLVFATRMSPEDHLARHRCADLFLDTLPYNAHTTTTDALWSGLPVLTCPGETFGGRVAASCLRAMELPELIAATRDDYERLAVQLASDPDALAQIRRKTVGKRLNTALFDTARYTNHIEQAFTAMHDRRLAGLEPADIRVTTR